MPIYVPKEIIHIEPTFEAPLIFLVGPIRGGADWQATLCHIILQRNPKAHIACPCRWDENHDLAEYFYQPFVDGPHCPRQRRWEEHYIQMAALGERPGCVLAYLPLEHPFRDREEMDSHQYATDTRREMGKFAGWLKYTKWLRLVIGGNPLFYGLNTMMDDIETAGEQSYPFIQDMHELVDAALHQAMQ